QLPGNPLANARFTRLTNFESALPAISPDGKFAAFLSYRDRALDVWLTQIGSGQFRNLTPGNYIWGRRPVLNLGFSGDGSEIWSGGSPIGVMRALPLMGGPARPFLGDHVAEVAWSADGRRMVYHTDAAGDPMFVADATGADARQIYVDPIP